MLILTCVRSLSLSLSLCVCVALCVSRLWRMGTSSSPSDDWWLSSRPLTTAESSTTPGPWWVLTRLWCVRSRSSSRKRRNRDTKPQKAKLKTEKQKIKPSMQRFSWHPQYVCNGNEEQIQTKKYSLKSKTQTPINSPSLVLSCLALHTYFYCVTRKRNKSPVANCCVLF